MEKSRYLSVFEYNEDLFPSIKDKITTFDGKKVTILHKLKSNSLLALVEDEDGSEVVKTYDLNGRIKDNCLSSIGDDLSQLYVDISIKKWVNVSGDSTNIKYSPLYDSKEDALENLKEDEFDTIMIRMFK